MRHEKILLVVLSYVIGFTAAYIAFGVHGGPTYPYYAIDLGSHKKQQAQEHTAIAVEQTPQVKSASYSSDQGVEAYYTEKGLFAKANDKETVISGKLQAGIEPGPGFHVRVPFFEVSPSGTFVYYCEQQLPDDQMCHNYVYDIAAHVSHPVSAAGTKITTEVDNQLADLEWQDDDIIAYNEFISRSKTEPWKLTLQ